jgi:uncharacterized OB-fold protein
MPTQFPTPIPDSDSREYWEGLKRGELCIQRCDACDRYVFYPRALCPHCSSDRLSWVTASGRGTIYTYTIVNQAYGDFAAQVPYVVALVTLEEGVRMMTRIVDRDSEKVNIDAPVAVTFTQVDEELTLPYFKLVE